MWLLGTKINRQEKAAAPTIHQRRADIARFMRSFRTYGSWTLESLLGSY